MPVIELSHVSSFTSYVPVIPCSVTGITLLSRWYDLIRIEIQIIVGVWDVSVTYEAQQRAISQGMTQIHIRI
jgi:hypothetical protein